jgi:CRISPR/Cas system-associated protein Csm6
MVLLRGAYPQWAKGLTKDAYAGMVNVWGDLLKDYEYGIVQASVKSLMASEEWPPSISQVIDKIKFIQSGGQREMSEQEAWSLISKAISNSSYNAAEEFEKLPKQLQNVVRTPQQLKNWALMDSDTVQSVVSSNFMRSYKAVVKNDREFEALPNDVKSQIEMKKESLMLGLSDKFSMPE